MFDREKNIKWETKGLLENNEYLKEDDFVQIQWIISKLLD